MGCKQVFLRAHSPLAQVNISTNTENSAILVKLPRGHVREQIWTSTRTCRYRQLKVTTNFMFCRSTGGAQSDPSIFDFVKHHLIIFFFRTQCTIAKLSYRMSHILNNHSFRLIDRNQLYKFIPDIHWVIGVFILWSWSILFVNIDTRYTYISSYISFQFL